MHLVLKLFSSIWICFNDLGNLDFHDHAWFWLTKLLLNLILIWWVVFVYAYICKYQYLLEISFFLSKKVILNCMKINLFFSYLSVWIFEHNSYSRLRGALPPIFLKFLLYYSEKPQRFPEKAEFTGYIN